MMTLKVIEVEMFVRNVEGCILLFMFSDKRIVLIDNIKSKIKGGDIIICGTWVGKPDYQNK